MKKLAIYFFLLTVIISSCSKKGSDATPTPTPTPTPEQPPVSPNNTGLTISESLNVGSPSYDLLSGIIYTSSTQTGADFMPLPATYNDNIKSFNLPKGYMVVFAENQNGTGESICYVAAVSDIKINLTTRLVGKVSFVRFMPIQYVNKKGICSTSINDVNALQGSWFYNWGLGASSSQTQKYVPMTWGKGAATSSNAVTFIGRRDIDHLLSFNEPDNSSQSNISNISDAVTGYKLMLQTGLRMVSPAVTQDNSTGSTKWLPQFVSAAEGQNARIDVIALHWYDWGNQTNDKATDALTADAVLTRFKNYVGKLHAAYPNKALWFTEYNCNPARSEAVHEIFMKISADYLNSLPYVERYAYFFPSIYPATYGAPDYKLTPLGQTWFDIVSQSAYSDNIIPN